MTGMAAGIVEAERIYTSFSPLKKAESILVLNGRVLAAGRRDKVRAVARAVAETLGVGVEERSYGDAVVVPGFVDAHAHIGGVGFALTGIDLRGSKSIEEFLERVRRGAGRFSDWVYGRGWDHEEMGAWPTRWDIDEVLPDKPAIFIRVCGHVAVLNTMGMERLGLLSSRDRLVDRTCSGEPTGLVYEELVAKAVEEVKKSLNPLQVVSRAAEEFLRYGVTMVGDMDVSSAWLKGLFALRASTTRMPRVRVYLRLSLFEKFYEMGIRAPVGDDMLRIVGVKAFADGTLGARTAYLSEPYSDDPSTRGVLLMDSESVKRLAEKAQRLGYDVAVHAIGDAALAEVVKGYREAGCQCRVEHASLADDGLVEALATSGARVAVQPHFIHSDSAWLASRLGSRIGYAYRFKTMLVKGVRLGFSSDAPVEPVNPLLGVEAAATRRGLGGDNERVGLVEALHLHTRGAALVLGEDRAGCLEPGCYADYAVLSHDPVEAGVEGLGSVEVVETVVAGARKWP